MQSLLTPKIRFLNAKLPRKIIIPRIKMKRLLTAVAFTFALAGQALAEQTLMISHGPVPTPTYIDLGALGDSVGDQRIWQFDGQTTDQQNVVMDFMMITTGQGSATSGMERRVTIAVFSVGPDAKDTILIQGVGLYPKAGSTIKSDSVLQRAVIGGTGKYAGAIGTITSTHLPDDTWQHAISLK
jgi:hypothetical protein